MRIGVCAAIGGVLAFAACAQTDQAPRVIGPDQVQVRGHTISLHGVDAPRETGAACEAERDAAVQARAGLEALIAEAEAVDFRKSGMACLMFMTCDGFVTVDGLDVSQWMIGEGLAAPPSAEGAYDWCATQAPAEGERRLITRIVRVEDSGFPLYTLITQTNMSAVEVPYSLNASGADIGEGGPERFAGSMATIYWAPVEVVTILTMSADGVSLTPPLPEDAAALTGTVTGVLSGAAEPTSSDLPNVITITPSEGDALMADMYVTPEIAAANGRTVTVGYRTDARREVTFVREYAARAAQ